MFDTLCERICENCVNADEFCNGIENCPFCDDFNRLEELCKAAEEFADIVAKSAMENYSLSMKDAYGY